MTVAAASVEATRISRTLSATGNVVAWREIPIGSETGGLALVEIAVDEGAKVARGQVLARLDPDIALAAMARQRAVIAELEAALAIARSDAARARSVLPGVMSAQAIEQRETLVRTTSARLEAARAGLGEFEARHRQTIVVAPAAGAISSRSVAIGQVVQTGTELFRLIQEDRIEVDARVPEGDLAEAALGQPATVVGPSGEREHGTVRIVAPVVDPRTRLGTVRIALDGGTTLRPGMFARVEIATASRVALTVPTRALIWHQAKAHVFTVGREGVARLTAVGLGRGLSDMVEIVSGLEAGDRIVTQGGGLLSDGDTVHVRTTLARGER